MIHDITSQLAYGELVNSQRNSTYGWLRMSGGHTSVVIQLTGNCASSLYGHHIEFESQLEQRYRTSCRQHVRNYQVGPIGHSSLQVSNRNEDGSVQGELCLEWFGQDGHIRVDHLPVKVQFVRDRPLLAAPLDDGLALIENSPWHTLSDLPALKPVEMGSPKFTTLLDEKRLLRAAKSSSCHQDHRDVARAANAREARLFTNVMRGQRAAHQPDVPQRTGACQLCSSAMLGEELCFRHTTILGSRR